MTERAQKEAPLISSDKEAFVSNFLPPTVEAIQKVSSSIVENLIKEGADAVTATEILMSALAHITGYSIAVLQAEGMWQANDPESRKIIWTAIRESRDFHLPRVELIRNKDAH